MIHHLINQLETIIYNNLDNVKGKTNQVLKSLLETQKQQELEQKRQMRELESLQKQVKILRNQMNRNRRTNNNIINLLKSAKG